VTDQRHGGDNPDNGRSAFTVRRYDTAMRGVATLSCFVVSAVMAIGVAEARPTVAVNGIEVAGDGVGVDVEATGVARELTQALRREAEKPGGPLQLVDPMMVADDVEALVWGKLIRDGDSYVITTHLSVIGTVGDTVSYRAHVRADDTSSVDIARWAKVIYTSLLEQIDLDAHDDATPDKPMTEAEILAVRDPSGVADVDDDPLDGGTDDPVLEARRPLPRTDRTDDADAAQSRRALRFSAAIAIGGFATWTFAALRVSDAQNQLTRLTQCFESCSDAIDAANRQGQRWERISYIAAPVALLATGASIYFGYKGYSRRTRASSSSELVGSLAITPVITPDAIGAAAAATF
jgi:hypothetical protein